MHCKFIIDISKLTVLDFHFEVIVLSVSDFFQVEDGNLFRWCLSQTNIFSHLFEPSVFIYHKTCNWLFSLDLASYTVWSFSAHNLSCHVVTNMMTNVCLSGMVFCVFVCMINTNTFVLLGLLDGKPLLNMKVRQHISRKSSFSVQYCLYESHANKLSFYKRSLCKTGVPFYHSICCC